MGKEFVAACSQVKEVHLVGQAVESLHIVADGLLLMRELADEVAGERLASLRYAVGMTVAKVGDAVHAVAVSMAYL